MKNSRSDLASRGNGKLECRMLRRSFLALPLLAFAQSPTTVFLVRHAERNHGTDPDEVINEKGKVRALELSRILHDVHLTHIFVSEYRRTAQTAAPVALAQHLTPLRVPSAKASDLAARLRALPQGSNALVVSHSDKLPAILASFGHSVPELAQQEYDRFFVLSLPSQGKSSLLALRFGAKD